MTSDRPNPDQGLPPAAVRAILQRATEIDGVSADDVSEVEVHAIAAELGITDAAVTRALAEHQQLLVADARLLSRQHLARVGLVGAAGGFAFSLLSAPLGIGLLTVETCSLVLAMSSRGRARYRRFLGSNGALWLGVILGPAALGMAPNLVIPVMAATASALLGSGAMLLRDSLEGPSSPGPQIQLSSDRIRPQSSLVRRIWRAVVGDDSVQFQKPRVLLAVLSRSY